jgi:hypothetical protein
MVDASMDSSATTVKLMFSAQWSLIIQQCIMGFKKHRNIVILGIGEK